MQERAAHLDFDVRFEGARDVLAKPHRHEYFQIQVGIEGGDHQVIGGAVRPFGRGYLSFVLPYRVHLVRHPPGARYAIVNFSQRFLWPELDVPVLDLESTPPGRCPELAPFLLQPHLDFHFDGETFDPILRWLDELAQLNRERQFGAMAAIRGVLLQLLGRACHQHGAALAAAAQNHPPPLARRDVLRQLMAYLRDRLREDISLNDAAEAMAVSPTHLAHLLKAQTGRSFTDLLTERRMDAAKTLLVNTRMQVRDVAHQVGFVDDAYFNRRFRQWVGETPRRFRSAALVATAA